MASADAPTEQQNEEIQAQQRNDELRRILNNSYAFVRGEQNTQAFSAMTYEELAREQIKAIEGAGTEARPTELDRLDHMEDALLSIVAEIKAADPSQFILKNQNTDVNTAVEPEP